MTTPARIHALSGYGDTFSGTDIKIGIKISIQVLYSKMLYFVIEHILEFPTKRIVNYKIMLNNLLYPKYLLVPDSVTDEWKYRRYDLNHMTINVLGLLLVNM
jgi:hypothetical protein